MRIRRAIFTGAGCIGAAVGCFALTSALGPGSDGGQSKQEVIVARPDLTTNIPASSGKEPPIFTGGIAALDKHDRLESSIGDARISLYRSTDGQVCADVVLPTVQGGSCFGNETVATGIAYTALGDRDGHVYMVGVVPDDAARVVINGEKVNIQQNVWFYAGRTTDPSLAFTVESEDGTRSVTLGQ